MISTLMHPRPPLVASIGGSAAALDASEKLRYVWLADLIRTAIERGNFADNQALPSEREMAEKYDVSRVTVRKTIQLLVEQRVIYNEQGRGTFVSPALVRRTARFVDGFSEDTASRGGVAGQRILAVEQSTATMAMAGLLGVRVGHPLTRIRRVRLIDHEPIGLHDAYVMAGGALTITRDELDTGGSLYTLMREKFGLVPTEAVENLSATEADAEEAELLQVKPGSPLLMCERVTLSERREPIEYCMMKYVPSYRYSTRVTKRSVLG